jgi:hypothetical protein
MVKPTFSKTNLSDARVIMVIMRGSVVELLCQGRRDGFQYLTICSKVHVSACGHVLLCQSLNAVASRGPGSSGAYPVLKAPECGCWEPRRVLSQGDEAD